MPVQYEGVTVEHLCVRSGVGVFDVSHMGGFLYVVKEQVISYKKSHRMM